MLDKANAPKFYYCQAFSKGNIVTGIVEFQSRVNDELFFCRKGMYKISSFEFWAYQESYNERYKYVTREATEEEIEELIVVSDINKLEKSLLAEI